MRNDDEFDLPRSFALSGVSPAWRVVAILALLASGGLLVLCLALGLAFIAQRKQLGRTPAPPAGVNIAPIMGGGADEDDEEREPANPPYPINQDLAPPSARAPIPGEEPAAPRHTARDRFLEIGQEAWTAPNGHFPQHVSVSPDGQSIAYVNQRTLLVGTLGGELHEVGGHGQGMPGGFPPPWGGGVARHHGFAVQFDAVPVWSGDGQAVCFADSEGGLRRYDLQTKQVEKLPLCGDAPLVVPGAALRLVFRRSRSVPKADRPDHSVPPDPVEIVLADPATREVRVLVPESSDTWRPLAVSADGKRLALASDHGQPRKRLRQQRLFVLDLTAQPPAPPQPIGPAVGVLESACWSADGKGLVWLHEQKQIPADWWEANEPNGRYGFDLFHLDVATGRETRLSRGGGASALSPAVGDTLFYLTWKIDAQPPGLRRLQRVTLPAALAFAAKEQDQPPRDQEAWTKLIDRVLESAAVAPEAHGEQLKPEVLARLADTFARIYRERFQAEPPADANGWERLQRELQSFTWAKAPQARFALVLGAAQGEYLHRRHGAIWRLAAGPLTPPLGPAPETEDTDPFGIVANPFQGISMRFAADNDEEDEAFGVGLWLRTTLSQAEGRTVVLTNAPAAGCVALEKLIDPDLERAVKLLAKKRGDEADRVLLDLMKQKKHERNRFLVLHVGRLLHEHSRFDALRRLVEPHLKTSPPDARLYNLLGLALLEHDPNAAAAQFQNALRCNLYYSPGYLNLAQAYEKAGQREAAIQCLRHCVRLTRVGVQADDARQRLSVLLQPGNP